MVGGMVIGLARGKESTLLHVQDNNHLDNTCSVRVIERRLDNSEPVQIEIGDAIWWQCGKCMWTPRRYLGLPEGRLRCGVDFDIHLPKVGYSH